MTLDEYQKFAFSTAIYPDKGTKSERVLFYTVFGLTEEAGEVAGKLKRLVRGDYASNEDVKEKMAIELGDVLWYLSMCANELGYSLQEIAGLNVEKLLQRKENGTLKGSGDDR